MKILHILDHSLPVQSGYAFRSAAILREQRKRGWLTLQLTGIKHGRQGDTNTVDGIDYLRTPLRQGWVPGLLQRLPAGDQLECVLALREQLRAVIARERPDILQAHSPVLNALAAFGLGRPVVYEMRSSWEDAAVSNGTTREGSLRYRVSRQLETWALRRADAVTTICEGLRREIIERGVPASRVTVIPNAVDVDSFTNQSSAAGGPVRERLGLSGCFVLGFIGSLFAWEGLALAIEALPRVLSHRPDTRLLLVGGGMHEPALRAMTRRLGLEQQIIFAGQVPHAQVGAYYEAVDLLVYPRLSMRLTDMVTPLKPLEAMALGKNFLASDVGGHQELVRDGKTGLLFRAGDAQALADGVLLLMENANLRQALREEGGRYVREERTWRGSVQGYEDIYQGLLRSGAGT